MRKLTKLLSALIVLVLATAFIGCGNPSSSDNGGGNSNSPTYTLPTNIAYLSDTSSGFIFYDDYSVTRIINYTDSKMTGTKWRIGNGNTVEIYAEGSTDNVLYTFTANTDFSQLTCDGQVFYR